MLQKHQIVTAVAMASSLCSFCGSSFAAEGVLTLLDRKGDPVSDVVVYALPHVPVDATLTPSPSPSPSPAVATMEQIDNRFVPHVLVVQTGTLVAFPNNDSVSHHVYSFSESKRFELDLYRGNIYTPELFDKPGLVVLGCNIHDNMLGYILVVDTPFFAISGNAGQARFSDLPEGDYEMQVWTPRLPIDQQLDAFDVHIGSGATWQQQIEFSAKLLPAHETEQGSLSWKDY